jgi:hypothetical protein
MLLDPSDLQYRDELLLLFRQLPQLFAQPGEKGTLNTLPDLS